MRANLQLPRSSWLSAALPLASLVLVVGILYWAREVLIPIALGVLLTFILAPIVTVLRRRGLGRTPSVVLTVVLTFALLGGIGMMITVELRSLANELPKYRQNIRKKISDVRLVGKGGAIEKVQATVKEMMDEIKKEEPGATNASAAVPVVVTGAERVSPPGMPLLGPLLGQMAAVGLVIVLVIFMLLRREDLRDRLLRLAGYGRLATTTKAMDEAGKRVSRYLLRQCLLNAGYGTGFGLGLFLIGLPYALLWGFLAAVARFIPYVGPWLGAVAPILMSLAVFDTWTAPLMVIGLVAGWELINNMLVEPLVYGQSIGVSEVALLIMIAFWTWLWGPIGLVLAAPLTVCLLVISKNVDGLEFVGLLLSSEPALEPHHVFYQRLVAKDGDEAQAIVTSYLKEHSRTELFERLLIPTLVCCRRDYERGRLNDDDRAFVSRAIRQILNEGEESSGLATGEAGGKIGPRRLGEPPDGAHRGLILGCPANDEEDELALMMLAELLRAAHWNMRVLSSEILLSETLAEVEKAQPALVCVGCLAQGSLFPLRQYCKRLRARFPALPILVGRWGAQEREETEHPLAGLVQAVGSDLAETQNQVIQFAQVTPTASTRQDDSLALAQRGSRQQNSIESLALSEQP